MHLLEVLGIIIGYHNPFFIQLSYKKFKKFKLCNYLLAEHHNYQNNLFYKKAMLIIFAKVNIKKLFFFFLLCLKV